MKGRLGFKTLKQCVLVQILLLLTLASEWVVNALLLSETSEIQDKSSIVSSEIDRYIASDKTINGIDDNRKSEDDVILLVTVEGEISGVSRSTGEILWQNNGSGSRTKNNIYENRQAKDEKEEILFSPLVSTTTNTISEAWRMCKCRSFCPFIL